MDEPRPANQSHRLCDKEWDLPPRLPGAESPPEVKFCPADELLDNPDMKAVLTEAGARQRCGIAFSGRPNSMKGLRCEQQDRISDQEEMNDGILYGQRQNLQDRQ
jgi:hypothetical protein